MPRGALSSADANIRPMNRPRFDVRPAADEDRLELAAIMSVVAEERDKIATEPPVDIEARAAAFDLEGSFVAVADSTIIGSINVTAHRWGFGAIGMLVVPEWRSRGVGSALLTAAVGWARMRGLHKLSLEVFPGNVAAIGLYRKFGFVEEGRRVEHIRRASGELWDVVEMGLLL
jgi:RimJ/RimL family protein N-acetyltransferase